MSTTVDTAVDVRPFEVEIPDETLQDLRRRIDGDALAREGDRRRSVAGRAARDDAGPRALLGNGLRLPTGSRRG